MGAMVTGLMRSMTTDLDGEINQREKNNEIKGKLKQKVSKKIISMS